MYSGYFLIIPKTISQPYRQVIARRLFFHNLCNQIGYFLFDLYFLW